VEVLVHDEVVVIHELPAHLVGEVPALVGDFSVGGCDTLYCSLAAVRATLFSREVFLGRGELCSRPLAVATLGHKVTVARRHECAHAEVDSDDLPGRR
jgi:hypothetical protein